MNTDTTPKAPGFWSEEDRRVFDLHRELELIRDQYTFTHDVKLLPVMDRMAKRL